MSEKILSDAELNALFTVSHEAHGQGSAVRGRAVKTYDFRFPQIFVNEHLHTMELIFQDFAKSGSSAISTFLNLPVQILFKGIEEQTCGKFCGSVPKPAVLVFCRLQPTGVYGIFEMATDLSLPIVDRMLGGEGKPAAARALTDIETAIVNRFIERLIGELNKAWKKKLDKFSLAPDGISTKLEHPRVSIPAMEEQAGFTVAFELKAGIAIGKLRLCLPQSALRQFLPQLGGMGKYTAGLASAADLVKAKFNEVKLPVSVFMGDTKVTIGDFTKLQKGDIIPLMNLEKNVMMKIGAYYRLYGRMGRVKNKKAVQVVSLIPADHEVENGK